MKLLILGFFIIFYNLNHSYSKINKLKSVKVNNCIKVSMVQEVTKQDVFWFVYAENICNNIKKIKKQLKIIVAKNVTAHKGLILDIRDFIVPKKHPNSSRSTKKLIFNVSLKNPNQKGFFKWILF